MRLTARAAAYRSKLAGNRAGKVYCLTVAIPETLRPGSAGRRVLESIRKHRGATATQIRKDMPAGFSDATLRFYLGKFQRNGLVIG